MTEPTRIQVTRFRCPHCSRLWAKRRTAQIHMNACQKDPAVQGCGTCLNWCRAIPEQWECHDPGEPEGCAEGIDLGEGRKTKCPTWEAKAGET